MFLVKIFEKNIPMFCGRVLYPTFVMWMIRGRRESPDPVPWA
ncbi:MAG: hypothetical protein ACREOI_12510 [bacterium]